MEIAFGTPIVYLGSKSTLWGGGVYIGPCHCSDCQISALVGVEVERHRIATPMGGARHVRRRSFEVLGE